ncbi:VPS4-associated protein 1 [Diutina catenulata]
MAGPFENHYTCRRVAPSDQKACSVCYKPTPNVLITDNNVDFFYICEAHLVDPQFASAIKPDEYHELVKTRIDLEGKIDKTTQERYKHKPYMWQKVWSSKPKEEDKDKPAADKYGELTKELEQQESELEETRKKIDGYKFKNYTLNDSMYKVRLNNYNNARAAKARKAKIESAGFFPDVPKGTIS